MENLPPEIIASSIREWVSGHAEGEQFKLELQWGLWHFSVINVRISCLPLWKHCHYTIHLFHWRHEKQNAKAQAVQVHPEQLSDGPILGVPSLGVAVLRWLPLPWKISRKLAVVFGLLEMHLVCMSETKIHTLRISRSARLYCKQLCMSHQRIMKSFQNARFLCLSTWNVILLSNGLSCSIRNPNFPGTFFFTTISVLLCIRYVLFCHPSTKEFKLAVKYWVRWVRGRHPA